MEKKVKVISGDSRTIHLGAQGEHNATVIVFDCTDLVEQYGEGVLEAVYRRANDPLVYPAVLSQSGTASRWVIDEAVNRNAGQGRVSLSWIVNGESVLAKPVEYLTRVASRIGEATEDAPEAWQSYVDAAAVRSAAAVEAAEKSENIYRQFNGSKSDLMTLLTELSRALHENRIYDAINLLDTFLLGRGELA